MVYFLYDGLCTSCNKLEPSILNSAENILSEHNNSIGGSWWRLVTERR